MRKYITAAIIAVAICGCQQKYTESQLAEIESADEVNNNYISKLQRIDEIDAMNIQNGTKKSEATAMEEEKQDIKTIRSGNPTWSTTPYY